MWLGRDPLALSEITFFENGADVVGGPAGPDCTAPAEAGPAVVFAETGAVNASFDPGALTIAFPGRNTGTAATQTLALTNVGTADAARAINGSAKSARIFAENQNNDPTLEERLGLIQAPSLIIWGDQDRVLHVSGGELFRKGIRNSELLVLPGIGHMPLMEKARECSAAWLKFADKAQRSVSAAA